MKILDHGKLLNLLSNLAGTNHDKLHGFLSSYGSIRVQLHFQWQGNHHQLPFVNLPTQI